MKFDNLRLIDIGGIAATLIPVFFWPRNHPDELQVWVLVRFAFWAALWWFTGWAYTAVEDIMSARMLRRYEEDPPADPRCLIVKPTRIIAGVFEGFGARYTVDEIRFNRRIARKLIGEATDTPRADSLRRLYEYFVRLRKDTPEVLLSRRENRKLRQLVESVRARRLHAHEAV